MKNAKSMLINFLFAFLVITIFTPFIDIWLRGLSFNEMDRDYFIQVILNAIGSGVFILIINKIIPFTTIININKE